jgi:predicted signal transduction protein with EAL and GGDEF domain
MAPAILAIQALRGQRIDMPVIVAGCALLFLLVLARTAELVRLNESTVRELRGTEGVLRASLSERDALAAQLEHQAFHDSLTDLANRALFNDRVRQALARARRSGGGLAEDADLGTARQLAERVIATLAAPFPLVGGQVTIHASIGIAFGCCATPTSPCTPPRAAARAPTRCSRARCCARSATATTCWPPWRGRSSAGAGGPLPADRRPARRPGRRGRGPGPLARPDGGLVPQMPIDAVKIDKSFVDGVAGAAEESAVARALIALATTLHLDTVAEGVERPRAGHRPRRARLPPRPGLPLLAPHPAADMARLTGQQPVATTLCHPA